MERLRAHKGFLIAECVLYVCFLWMDLTGVEGSMYVKYAGIILCVLYACHLADAVDGYLTIAALCFTAAADVFLLILDRDYVIGVLLFCVVQAFYAVRLARAVHPWSLWEGVLRFGLPSALIFFLPQLGLFSLLNVIVVFYYCNLLINACKSARFSGGTAFTIGLFLFAACDLCVGLHNLPLSMDGLKSFVNIAMWGFYLPSQVLITCSID